MTESEKLNLKEYRDYIVNIVRPSYIKWFMNEYLDQVCVERILSLEAESVTSAAECLLDALCDLKAMGWFQAFMDSLNSTGYTGLCHAMQRWDFKELEDIRDHRTFMRKIEPSFTKQIKPCELVNHMCDCFIARECEEIRAIEDQKGIIAASEKLVECLQRSDKSNWFKSLKMALSQCDLISALNLLEMNPDTNGKEVGEDGESPSTMATVCFEFRDEASNQGEMCANHPGNTPEVTAEQTHGSGEKKLREYQRELALSVFNGENTIICAPTGCGKTIVALAICEHHLKEFKQKAKIVFMATKVDVYNQQYKLFQEHFSQKDENVRINGQCGEEEDPLSLSFIVENNDIIVLTPQILVNALHYGDVPSLSVFSLLIFDECHNTTGKHPYNMIMTRYLDDKLNQKLPLPQVVGLTASVGIGTFKNETEAKANICQLCANLDTHVLSTVQKHRDELQTFVHMPEKDFFLASMREDNQFISIIHKIMSDIESLAKTVYNIDSLSNILNRDYGSQKYEQWIVAIQQKCRVLQIEEEEEERRVCRALYNYTEHLRKYNDALIINEDARMKDALEYLEAFFLQVKNAGYEETERCLTELFDVQQERLRQLASGGQQENPKLDELKFILDEEYRNNAETRTVLFVRTRAMADALKKWIEETDSLKFLKPGVLIGRGRKSHQLIGSGMTLTSKKGILDSFKSSNQSKILIATSVADEGIDIPSCNLVLMYEYVGNVVKMVQVRGRGRAQGSKCILISNKKEVIDKEKQNLHREKIVEKAIAVLQRSPNDMRNKISVLQREDKVRRDQLRATPERPQVQGRFELLCSKCKRSACFSQDLRVLQESHHIVLDRSIFERCRTLPHPKPSSFGSFRKTKKLLCGDCEQDWGIVASYQTIQNLPVVKIESFVVKNCTTGEQQYFRRWRDVTFAILTFSIEDDLVGYE